MLQRVLAVTGVCILFLGAYLLYTAPSRKGGDFADTVAYEKARGERALPPEAPLLPACAEHISITAGHNGIENVSFVCPNTQPDDAYVKEIEKQFSWNVLIFDGGRVVLERIKE